MARVGLDVLVEVHDEPELERALEAGADLIGVNQRDLVTFEVDQHRAARMAPLIPEERCGWRSRACAVPPTPANCTTPGTTPFW